LSLNFNFEVRRQDAKIYFLPRNNKAVNQIIENLEKEESLPGKFHGRSEISQVNLLCYILFQLM
jgi:hypothetical protein